MNTEKINELRNFIAWVSAKTQKTANFAINFWEYSLGSSQVEYSLWISGIGQKEFCSLDSLVDAIPGLKTLCLNKEVCHD